MIESDLLFFCFQGRYRRIKGRNPPIFDRRKNTIPSGWIYREEKDPVPLKNVCTLH